MSIVVILWIKIFVNMHYIYDNMDRKIEKNWCLFICNFFYLTGKLILKSVLTYLKNKEEFKMRITPVVTGIAAGMAAGAIVSAMAAGAMSNPSTRKAVKTSAKNMSHAAKKAAHDISSSMMG